MSFLFPFGPRFFYRFAFAVQGCSSLSKKTEGKGKHSKLNSLLQVADVDDGAIRWVHHTQVTHVLHGLDGIGQEGWDGFED